jgi:hypothetical protein
MAKKIKPINMLPKTLSVEPPELPIEVRAMSQIERLSKMGTDCIRMNQQSLSGVYNVLSGMSIPELQAKLKSPSLTVLERSIIIHITKISSTSKDGLDAIKYLHDRVAGKVESKLEHTGVNGGPIKMEIDAATQLERTMANMTDKEIDALEDTMNHLDVIVGNISDKKKD